MKIKKIVASVLMLTMLITTLPVASNATALAASEETVFKGVDVSRWNGAVDWKTMKKRGVDFAILRCYSYGKDKLFDEYYEGASAQGIDIGAYIYMYATTEREAVSEANATLAALDGRALDYPLFLDIEDEILKKINKKTLTSLCITELEIFRKAGYRVGTYSSKSFQETHLDMSRLSDYYTWTAKWSLYSTEKDKKKFYFKNMDPYDSSRPIGELWQFTNGGYGPYYGAEGQYLDLDYCYVDFSKSLGPKDPADHKKPERQLMYSPISVMSGDDVVWVQATLYQLGYQIAVDGYYGPNTRAAVREFQAKCGLAESGIVDKQTADKLLDAYEHRNFSADVKYDPNNGAEVSEPITLDYAEAFIPGEGMKLENGELSLSGFTLYRASDKSYYCTDGAWHKASAIAGEGLIKAVFEASNKTAVSDFWIRNAKTKSDTFTFTAVWVPGDISAETYYIDGNEFSIIRAPMSYEEAEKYCLERGGELAVLETEEEISALRISEGERLFIGAKKTDEGWFWNSGDVVEFPIYESVDGEGAYIAVSSRSIYSPHMLFAVGGEGETSGFVMKKKCHHENTAVENAVELSCTDDGYTGDKLCTDCGAVLSSGDRFEAEGHDYSAYAVTKAATCKSTGTKERFCRLCGNVTAKTIAKTNDHAFETTVIKKATTESGGKAVDTCSVCGLTKEYTFKKIKSVKLSSSSAAYTAKKLTPAVTVKDSAGNVLKKDVDYTVKYKNNKNIGTATVTVKFKGKYSGTVTKTFNIVPKAPSAPTLSSSNGKVTAKWKRPTKNMTGYVLEYSTASDFSKNAKTVKIKNKDTLTKTVKGISKGKKVYVRLRTYKTVEKTTYYSKWSKRSSIKVK